MLDLVTPWLPVGAGVFAFIIYLLTLAPGLVPGRFAIETVEAMNLLPGAVVRHPLWLLATRGITAAFPVAWQVYALNLFTAVCGALAVACTASLARRGIHDLICEFEALRMTPIDATREQADDTIDADDTKRAHRCEVLACYGSLVAAVALALNIPFWISSTSLHSQTFDLLLFIVTTNWILRYHGSGNISDMVVATFLFFLGLIEVACFIWLLPVFLFLLIRGGIRFGQINESFFFLFLGIAFMGAALNTAIYLVLAVGNQAGDASVIGPLLGSLLKGHVSEIQRYFFTKGWVLVLCQTLLPLIVATGGLFRFSPMQDAMTRCKWNVINLIFSAATMLALSSAPGSAWSLARTTGALPIFAGLCAALAAGGLFVYWMLVASDLFREASDDPSIGPTSRASRMLSYGMSLLLVAMTLGTVPAYFAEADGRKTQFADTVSDIILDQAEKLDTKFLLTEEVLSVNLLVRAHVRKLSFTILPYRNPSAMSPNFASSLARIEEWVRLRPGSSQVATIGAVSFWQRLGIEPTPCGLLFVEKLPDIYQKPEDLREAFGESVRPVVAALGDRAMLWPELESAWMNIRLHASRMANELGVYLEAKGETAGADALYAEAVQIDANNICAVINRYGLLRRQDVVQDAVEALASQILLVASDTDFAEKLSVAVKRNGRLAPQPADRLIPLLLADWGSNATAVQPVLIRICKDWLRPRVERVRPAKKETVEDPTQQAAPQASSESRQLAAAVAFIHRGQPREAEERLRALLNRDPDNLPAWAVLADILLGRSAVPDIKEKILPSMRRAAKQPEDGRERDPGHLALLDLTEGHVYMQGDPPDFSRARSFFLNAIEKKPDMTAAHDSLLRSSIALGNTGQLEEDIILILEAAPTHARANAVLGSLRMSQERFDEAEQLLKASITEEPIATALNDYAELLRKQKKTAGAEELARRSIQASPIFYPAWNSLSGILLEQERAEEAYQAIQCALVFEPRDVRLHLTHARILAALKRVEDAEKTLEQAEPLLKAAPAAVRKDFEELKSQITRK